MSIEGPLGLGNGDLVLGQTERRGALETLIADSGVVISDELVAQLLTATGGRRPILLAALDAWHRGDLVTDLAPGLLLARAWVADAVSMATLDQAVVALCVLGPSTMAEVAELVGPASDSAIGAAVTAGLLILAPEPDTEIGPVPVLADVVVANLVKEDPAYLRTLQAAQSQLREVTGQFDCGLAYQLAAEDWDRCAAIVDRWQHYLTGRGRFDLVHAATMALPLEYARNYPGVGHRMELLGRIPLGTTSTELPATFDEARTEFAQSGDLSLRRVLLAMVTRRRFGLMRAAREIAASGTPMAEASAVEYHGWNADFVPVWYLQAGISAMLADDGTLARNLFARGWTRRTRDFTGYVARDLAAKLSLLEGLQGDYEASALWLERSHAEQLRTNIWVVPYIAHTQRLAEAVAAVDQLDPGAEQLLRATSQPQDLDEQWAITLWLNTRFRITRGDVAGAHAQVQESVPGRETLLQSGLSQRLVALARAEIEIARGQAAEALDQLRGIADTTGEVAALAARAHLLAGSAEKALDVAGRRLGDVQTTARARLELAWVSSEARFTLGQNEAALASARQAISLSLQRDDLRVLSTVPRTTLDALAGDLPELLPLLERLDRCWTGSIFPASSPPTVLTNRERDLLVHLATGRSLTAIAADSYVSVNTIKTHLKNLRRKLDASSRAAVVHEARRRGLLPDGL